MSTDKMDRSVTRAGYEELKRISEIMDMLDVPDDPKEQTPLHRALVDEWHFLETFLPKVNQVETELEILQGKRQAEDGKQ